MKWMMIGSRARSTPASMVAGCMKNAAGFEKNDIAAGLGVVRFGVRHPGLKPRAIIGDPFGV